MKSSENYGLNNLIKDGLKGIPAIPYNRILKQYARFQEMPFLTIADRKKVLSHYEIFASLKN